MRGLTLKEIYDSVYQTYGDNVKIDVMVPYRFDFTMFSGIKYRIKHLYVDDVFLLYKNGEKVGSFESLLGLHTLLRLESGS